MLPPMLHEGLMLLQADVSACSRLRHLVLSTWVAPSSCYDESWNRQLPEGPQSGDHPKLDWGLVKALSEALP